MITEHAVLTVAPGREKEFESAFAKAVPLISSMEGMLSLKLARSLETPNQYVLLVEWVSVIHHTQGFRGSPEYEAWRELLHPFYDPFPVVEHFGTVIST